MVIATRNDPTNTNIAFTVREIAPDAVILATANSPAAVDILEIAGADHVVQLGQILGAAMAARTLGLGGRSYVIGEFGGLNVAEACVVGTVMDGRSLRELDLRDRLGVGIIGVWDRGELVSTCSGRRCRSNSPVGRLPTSTSIDGPTAMWSRPTLEDGSRRIRTRMRRCRRRGS